MKEDVTGSAPASELVSEWYSNVQRRVRRIQTKMRVDCGRRLVRLHLECDDRLEVRLANDGQHRQRGASRVLG